MERTPIPIALIGDAETSQYSSIRDWLSQLERGLELRKYSGLEDCLSAAHSPQLVVVSQTYRGEMSLSQVEHAIGSLPVVRWVCVYGLWCESDGRHGSEWPTAVRVPFAGFRPRLSAELEILQGTRSILPLTAEREECFEFLAETGRPNHAGNGSVSIRTADRALRNWLADVIQEAGFTVQESSAEIQIIDLDDDRPLPSAAKRTIGLKGLVTVADDRFPHRLGVQRVLSKLCSEAELLGAVYGE